MTKCKRLSIIIPCYNEKDTIAETIEEVNSADIGSTQKEIIVIDDYSEDGTRDILKKIARKYKAINLIYMDSNVGKGNAIKNGLTQSTGDVIIIQDADLEYDPQDFRRLLYPIERGRADVVYGSRFKGGEPYRIVYNRNRLANKFLTTLSNLFTGLKLTDVETCYKMIKGDLARDLAKQLRAKRFGFEPEITALIAKSNVRVYEVGIGYYGRSKEEGKKIGFTDGLKTIWEIVYYNLTTRKK